MKKDSKSHESNAESFDGILSQSEKEKMKSFIENSEIENDELIKTLELMTQNKPKRKGNAGLGDQAIKDLNKKILEDAMNIKRDEISNLLSKIYHSTSNCIETCADYIASYYIGAKSCIIYAILKILMGSIWWVIFSLIWIITTIVARSAVYLLLWWKVK